MHLCTSTLVPVALPYRCITWFNLWQLLQSLCHGGSFLQAGTAVSTVCSTSHLRLPSAAALMLQMLSGMSGTYCVQRAAMFLGSSWRQQCCVCQWYLAVTHALRMATCLSEVGANRGRRNSHSNC
jgi:hypothetical protein